MHRLCKQLLLVSFAFYLTACVSTNSDFAQESSVMQHTAFNQKNRFVLQAIATVDENNQSWTTHMRWQQSDRLHFQIDIDPSTVHAARIVGTSEQVFMQTSKGTTHFAPTAEALIQNEFHHLLPVSYLYYWVRNLPVPGWPSVPTYNENHQLTSLVQGEWTISFENYHKLGSANIPSAIKVIYRDKKINVVITQCQFPTQ